MSAPSVVTHPSLFRPSSSRAAATPSKPAPLVRPHMMTTRVRSIAAATRGSTLLLPLEPIPASSSLSPINLPWATLMSTNANYPSFDIQDDAVLIGRKPPCGFVVSHQAISGLHCRIVRKAIGEGQDVLNSPLFSPMTSPAAATLSDTISSRHHNSLTVVEETDGVFSSHARQETLACIGESETNKKEDAFLAMKLFSKAISKPAVIEEEVKEEIPRAAVIVDEKIKRKSRIKVSEMVHIFTGQRNESNSRREHDEMEDNIVWKGTKNATISRTTVASNRKYEVWLEDLSTNGTFTSHGADSPIRVGNGNMKQLKNGSEITLLLPTAHCHDRISFILRVNGESPVGDSDDEAPIDPVTMVFTDIESSTTLWEAAPQAMNIALEEHDRTLRTLLARFRGYEVKTEGDAFMVAFFTVLDAVKWCLAVQEAFLRMKWPDEIVALPSGAKQYIDAHNVKCPTGTDAQLVFNGLRVRMGLHVGTPNCRLNPTTKRMDYYGPMVNLSARVSDTAYGGQIVCTEEVCRIVQDEVRRMKETAEKEWAEERGESEENEIEDDDGEDEKQIVHHDERHANNAVSSRLVCPSITSPRRIDSQRFARIKAEKAKKPTTLDNTLNFLTDLKSVTFLDCGVVPLKGIHGDTRIFQISSVSLTGRRWDPPLRFKSPFDGQHKIELGYSAPAPPPLTITLYNKHNIPLQIRRAILKNKKNEKAMRQDDSIADAKTEAAPEVSDCTAESACCFIPPTIEFPEVNSFIDGSAASDEQLMHYPQPRTSPAALSANDTCFQQDQQNSSPSSLSSANVDGSPGRSPSASAPVIASSDTSATVFAMREKHTSKPSPNLGTRKSRYSGSNALAASILLARKKMLLTHSSHDSSKEFPHALQALHSSTSDSAIIQDAKNGIPTVIATPSPTLKKSVKRGSRCADLAAEASFAAFDAEIRSRTSKSSIAATHLQKNVFIDFDGIPKSPVESKFHNKRGTVSTLSRQAAKEIQEALWFQQKR